MWLSTNLVSKDDLAMLPTSRGKGMYIYLVK